MVVQNASLLIRVCCLAQGEPLDQWRKSLNKYLTFKRIQRAKGEEIVWEVEYNICLRKTLLLHILTHTEIPWCVWCVCDNGLRWRECFSKGLVLHTRVCVPVKQYLQFNHELKLPLWSSLMRTLIIQIKFCKNAQTLHTEP